MTVRRIVAAGYFTSRPGLKGYVREMNSFLQVCKQVEVIGTPLMSLRQTKASSRKLRTSILSSYAVFVWRIF